MAGELDRMMLEIVIDGTPRSQQGSARGVAAWKKHVSECARTYVDSDSDRIDYVDVSLRLLHFCRDWGHLAGDLDNIAKPIIDAILGIAIFNDNQVKQILLRRTETTRHGVTVVDDASPVLAARLERLIEDPHDLGFIYVTVERTIEHTRLA